nr:hypothetical protein CFP56_06229 [Quercus suber]
MDGPWFVGEQYLHVQAWEADFHPYVAKISNTADIVYEDLPFLCFRCGRLGHREETCLEPCHGMNPKHPPGQEPHGETGMPDLENNHSPWKTVQTRWSNTRGKFSEQQARGKLNQCAYPTPSKPCEHNPLTDPFVSHSPTSNSVTG